MSDRQPSDADNWSRLPPEEVEWSKQPDEWPQRRPLDKEEDARASANKRKPPRPTEVDTWSKWNARFWGFFVPALLCAVLWLDFSDDGKLDNGLVIIPAILFLVSGGTAAELWRIYRGGNGR